MPQGNSAHKSQPLRPEFSRAHSPQEKPSTRRSIKWLSAKTGSIILMIILRKNEKEVEKIITEKINEIDAQEAQAAQEAVQAEVKVIEEPVAQKEESDTQAE